MEYKYLCSPIKLSNVTFRNRMFSSPMGGTDITAGGCIGPRSIKFYELRAYGGAAAVTVSECMVHPTDDSHAFRLDLSVPDSLPSFTYTADGTKVSIPGDSILCGLGLKPNTAVVEELRGTAPKFFAIGNCVRPDTITHAVYQGYHAALNI